MKFAVPFLKILKLQMLWTAQFLSEFYAVFCLYQIFIFKKAEILDQKVSQKVRIFILLLPIIQDENNLIFEALRLQKITSHTTGAQGCKFVKSFENFEQYDLPFSLSISVYLNLSWFISVYLGSARFILIFLIYHGLYQAILSYLGPFHTKMGYPGLCQDISSYISEAILSYIKLSQAIQGYLELSQAFS